MATMTIEIPEGKRAEWVDGVLTLFDEQPKGKNCIRKTTINQLNNKRKKI